MDDIESKEQPECLTASALGVDGGCRVAAFPTLDLSAAYTGLKNCQIDGSIINVLNRIVPFDYSVGYGICNCNFDYALAGATGTMFNRGARCTFQTAAPGRLPANRMNR
jgi:hypothetical protein